jgi:hypothetical protein
MGQEIEMLFLILKPPNYGHIVPHPLRRLMLVLVGLPVSLS